MDKIICRGCNKIYDDPLYLSCGDLLCRSCLNKSSDKQICTICNQKTTFCILNQTVKSYLDSIKVKKCSDHEHSHSASYCLQCESFNNIEQISIQAYH